MKSAKEILRKLFNENRAEWPQEDFKQLFVEPTYLGKLESIRPCVIVGGRGTGKTTSLKSLQYGDTLERLQAQGLTIDAQKYYGVLVRMNKNRVKAFSGGSFTEEHWGKVFAHFFNLTVCKELVGLTRWLEKQLDIILDEVFIGFISRELGLDNVATLRDLEFEIRNGLTDVQLHVNNPNSTIPPKLSIAEAPLRTFAEALKEVGLLKNETIFCCIDEYENLSNFQQATINTYIKHAEPPLSYKVGVRKNGFRNKQTLNEQDMLADPDDYDEIEIVDEDFEYFARAVAEQRLKFAQSKGVNISSKLKEFLTEYSFADELKALGAEKIAKRVLKALKESNDDVLYDSMKNRPLKELYFLEYWQARTDEPIKDIALDFLEKPESWKQRIENHGYSSLFWVSRGKGNRIRKYYCGERVFLALAGGNIRYFLELINSAINIEIGGIYEESDKPIIISQKSQTIATRDVGLNRLNQLEGLADNGIKLKRLVLAIGKVFFEYARTPENRTPETNSFILSGEQKDLEEIKKLLNDGVGHLAFEVEPATKATSSYELKDNEYRLHRIFAGFFEYSHRKKRRTVFKAETLLEVLENRPSIAIAKLVDENPKKDTIDLLSEAKDIEAFKLTQEVLPGQMALFSTFYDQE
jgi:hypothetical protein